MYNNERIIAKENTNAHSGSVVVSPIKIIWVGGIFLVSIIGAWFTLSWQSVMVFIVTTGISLCLGHSLGMHRRLIHKSYQCAKWMEYVFVHLGVIVGLAGPFGMIRTHDVRDWAQRQKKCHSYFSHQQPMLIDFYWQLFCDIKLDKPPFINIESEVADDKVYQWMEKTWMLQQLPIAMILFFLGGLSWVIWGVFIRVSVSILGHWFIGYYAHNEGHRDWHINGASVQGHNVRFAAILTMGESYHNNHHAYPGSAKLGLNQGQIDLGWYVLMLLSRIGMVWHIILPKDLPERPELEQL
jgi:stearoyl-CoA desaturase (delta-9 desaturase)